MDGGDLARGTIDNTVDNTVGVGICIGVAVAGVDLRARWVTVADHQRAGQR
jgi:hypothetical protein